MSKIKRWFVDERGMALITVLLILVLLTTLGLYSIWTSNSETALGGNERLNKMAYYVAESGLNEAIGRLDVTNPASSYYITSDKYKIAGPNLTDKTLWGGGKGYTSYTGIVPLTGGTSGFQNYSVYIYPSFENDPTTLTNGSFHSYTAAICPAGSLVLYNKAHQYADSPISGYSSAWSQGFPVFHVVSVARIKDPSGRVIASARLSADITKNILNVVAPGGMFSGGCLQANGASGIISGGTEAGLVTNQSNCSYSTPFFNQSGQVIGSPQYQFGAGIDVNSWLGFPLDQISQYATQIENDTKSFGTSNDVFGTSLTNSQIVFINNSSNLTRTFNGASGYGILVVSGNLDLNGGFTWHGLVYVRGDVTTSGGGGGVNIYGGIMAGGNVNTLNGNIKVYYNQSTIDAVSQNAFSTKMIVWKDERQ